jgi:autotransporter-associated beta strand protein
MSLTGVTNVASNSVSNALLTFATGQGTGTYSNTITVVYRDSSTLAGASTNVGSSTLTVTQNVYDHAQGSLSSSNVTFRVHVGYTSDQTTNIGVSNAVGFRVSLATLATNSSNNLSLASVTNVAAGGSSNALLTLSNGLAAGAFTNVIGVVYGDSTNLAGAQSVVGTNFLTVNGLVYSGQSTWTTNSGNWTNFANWNDGGTPGLDGSLSTNDTAAFGTGGGGVVTLNTHAELNALTFNASSYTLAGTGTISMVQGSNAPSIVTSLGSHLISNALVLANNVGVTNASGTLLTLAGAVSGSGAITKVGGGTLSLSSANSYTGGTILNAGTLAISNNAAFGSGAITFASNATVSALTTLLVTNDYTISGSATGTFDVGAGLNFDSSGVISGGGVLAKIGVGTLTLSTSNSYTGGTLLNTGVLTINATNALGTGAVTVASGALLDFGVIGGGAVTNTLLGSGTIVTTGTGTLTLGDSSAGFSGYIGADDAILRITNANAIGAATALFMTNGGTIRFSEGAASNSVTNKIVVASNSSGVIEHGTGTGTLTLAGELRKDAATLTLRGTNTGVVTISGGITGSAPNSDLVYDSGTFNVNASNSYNGPTYLINGAIVNANSNNALPTSSGPSSVYLDQTNTGSNWGTGSSVLNLGTSQTIASLSGISSSSVNLGNNTLTIGAVSGGSSFAGSISGAGGSLYKLGASTQTLSGNNTYTGGTTITNGAIITANANALGNGPLTLTGTGRLILGSILNIDSFVWDTVTSFVGFNSLANGYYLNATNAVTLSGTTNYFDLRGLDSQLTATPVQLFAFGTNGFNTNQFGILGDQASSYYALSIRNSNSLWVALATLPVPSGGTNTFSTTNTYPSVTFGTNSTLNITPTGNLTIQTNVTVNNQSTLNVDGILTASNTVSVLYGSTLSGIGTINGNVLNGGLLSPGSAFVNNPTGQLTINGNLTQTSTGTMLIQVAGAGSFSSIYVNGTAVLGGTMAVNPIGYTMQFGDQYQFLTATGGITGAFDSINMPSGYRGRFLLGNNNTTGSLLVAPQSYTQLATTQNQLNVATALDSFIPATSGDKLTVSTALDKLASSQYQQAFEAIQPTIYQSLGTIAFNLANAQNMELNQRLWNQRIAGSGFSMNGFADNTPIWEGMGDGNSVTDPSKDILRQGPDNRWGLFVDGNGIFAQANSANMLPGYNAQSGGITAGVSFRVNPTITVGAYTGYEGTYAKYNAGSSLADNSVRFGLFGTYGKQDGKGFYGNAVVGGAYNNYRVTRNISFSGLNRTANSTPSAGELDTMLAAGYNFRPGNWTFGPITSLQYTYLGVNSFNESGAQSLDLAAQGWNTSSLLYSLGAQAAYTWKATKNLTIVPQINLSWQHEFLQNPYTINSTMGGAYFANLSATPIRDFLYGGVGMTLEFKERWFTSIFYNAAAGNSDLSSQNIFLSFGCKF